MKLEVGETVTVSHKDGHDELVPVVNLFDVERFPCMPDQAVIARVGPDRNGDWYEFPCSSLAGRVMQ